MSLENREDPGELLRAGTEVMVLQEEQSGQLLATTFATKNDFNHAEVFVTLKNLHFGRQHAISLAQVIWPPWVSRGRREEGSSSFSFHSGG